MLPGLFTWYLIIYPLIIIIYPLIYHLHMWNGVDLLKHKDQGNSYYSGVTRETQKWDAYMYAGLCDYGGWPVTISEVVKLKTQRSKVTALIGDIRPKKQREQ